VLIAAHNEEASIGATLDSAQRPLASRGTRNPTQLDRQVTAG
jgi:hypothetical protein